MSANIEVLEKVVVQDGFIVRKAILHDGDTHKEGYTIESPDGRGVWLDSWEEVQAVFEATSLEP